MGALIIAAWPETPVRPTGLWYDRLFALLGLKLEGGFYRLGHAGCLLVCERTGCIRYFDCGRYECPPQMCRIRDAVHDPDVAIAARGRFATDGSLSNLDEVLLELAACDATHGEGLMVAAVVGGLDFDAACREAVRLQATIRPFRHLGRNSLNCTRFLLRITPFARLSWVVRVLEACSPMFGPGCLFLARACSLNGSIHLVDQGRCSCRGWWSAFLRGRPSIARTTIGRIGDGQVTLPIPARRAGVPPEARWLTGTAVSKWIAVTRAPSLARHEFRLRRWSDSGRQECDRVFELSGGAEFDPAGPFELAYPTDCQQCTVCQHGRTSRLTLVRR